MMIHDICQCCLNVSYGDDLRKRAIRLTKVRD